MDLLLKLSILFILLGYYFLNYHFSFSIPCFFYELTGFYCPTCGITRMLFALLNFDFIKAFNYNQLIFILFPFIIAIIGYGIYLYIFDKKDFILKKIPIWVFVLLFLIFFIFGIMRNLSYFPFLRP